MSRLVVYAFPHSPYLPSMFFRIVVREMLPNSVVQGLTPHLKIPAHHHSTEIECVLTGTSR